MTSKSDKATPVQPEFAASTSAVTAPPRRVSVDVLRGITIAAMILVNNPGSWGEDAIYSPLRHAAWHGCTPTDLVFPFFLFLVGASVALALGGRLERGAPVPLTKIFRRTVLLFALGLFLAAFPIVTWSPSFGWKPGLDTLRIFGVLQRIALCYCATALLFVYTGRRTRTLVVIACLLGSWWWMTQWAIPGMGEPDLQDPARNLAAYLDRQILGAHVWRGGVYDPEGLLSTIPALATTLLGLFAGEFLRQGRAVAQTATPLLVAGAGAVALGLLWGTVYPLNKPLWTSSYAVYTAGLASLALGLLVAIFDRPNPGRLIRGAAYPWVVYGVNALFVFVLSGVVARIVGSLWTVSVDGRDVAIKSWIYRDLLLTWNSAKNASLFYAIAWVVLFWLASLFLYRKHIVVKV